MGIFKKSAAAFALAAATGTSGCVTDNANPYAVTAAGAAIGHALGDSLDDNHGGAIGAAIGGVLASGYINQAQRCRQNDSANTYAVRDNRTGRIVTYTTTQQSNTNCTSYVSGAPRPIF